MTPEDFVQSIRIAVTEGAVKGVIEGMERPPGRRPDGRLVALSNWYNSLDDENKAMLFEALQTVSDQATYNMMLVLDGLLAIEPSGPKGRLNLTFSSPNETRLLNDPDKVDLASLFKTTI
jgi:hypothetical protein